jgi:hypothetical protein
MNDLRREAEPQLLNGISMSLKTKHELHSNGKDASSSSGGSTRGTSGGGIRVATIDNYQVQLIVELRVELVELIVELVERRLE